LIRAAPSRQPKHRKALQIFSPGERCEPNDSRLKFLARAQGIDRIKANENDHWNTIFARWQARLGEAGVADVPLFSELQIQDTAYPDRPKWFFWRSRAGLRDFHVQCQRSFNWSPDGLGLLGDDLVTTRYTLECLWEHRSEAEKLTAFLMLAMLRDHTHPPGSLAFDRNAQFVVGRAACERLGYMPDWHRKAARAIPSGFEWTKLIYLDKRNPFRTSEQIVDLLAEEHVERLRRQTAVALIFSDAMDPKVRAEINRQDKRVRNPVRL
jgi:hypothetical protein